MVMLAVHLRLAELYQMQKAGTLTDEHGKELQQCLQENARYCWDMMKLQQLSNVAVNVRDTNWLEELRIRIEALRLTGRVPKL